jgi:hypothetical protein
MHRVAGATLDANGREDKNDLSRVRHATQTDISDVRNSSRAGGDALIKPHPCISTIDSSGHI